MQLKRKAILIISVLLFTFILSLIILSFFETRRSIITIEENEVSKNIFRFQNELQNILNNLIDKFGDWSMWNDTYKFVNDRNEDYVRSNLADKTFSSLKINFMIFFNKEGNIIYEKGYDFINEKRLLVSIDFKKHLSPRSLFLNHKSNESKISNVILLPENPILVISRPILKSDGSGPIIGTLVCGRYMDSSMLNNIQTIIRNRTTINRIDQSLPQDFMNAKSMITKDNPDYINILDDNIIAGYSFIYDAYQKPILMVRIDIPREIYNQWKNNLLYFFLTIIIFGLFFTLAIIISLDKLLINRLKQLNSFVKKVSTNRDVYTSIHIKGDDELSDLSNEINRMLYQLKESNDKLKVSTDNFSSLVENITNLVWTIDRDFKFAFVNSAAIERKYSAEELQESEERFRSISISVQDAIIMMDNEGLITYWNPAAEKILGYDKEEIIGKNLHLIIAPIQHQEAYQKAFPDWQISGKGNAIDKTIELPTINKYGKEITIELSLSSVKIKNQWNAIGILRDITERKQYENEIKKAKEGKI